MCGVLLTQFTKVVLFYVGKYINLYKKICINHILSVNRPGCVVIVAEILVFGIVETGHLTQVNAPFKNQFVNYHWKSFF